MKLSDIDVINELRKISKLLTFAYSDKKESELEKIVTTDERKVFWVLIDGHRNSDEISEISGASARSVQRFQKLAQEAGLINNPKRKPASKIFDYVPPAWIELVPKEPNEESEDE